MELRKAWFPILLAAIWVVLAAAALTSFANFAGATARPAVMAQKEKAVKQAAGRRPEGRTLATRSHLLAD